ncbi:MAG: hypothetical protein E2598_08090 [Sphingobium sp.]|nr:hypothetical protein [Sphingobium sp.]
MPAGCSLTTKVAKAFLRVVAADLNDYYRFQVDHLSGVEGVRNVKTDVSMQTVKTGREVLISRR